MTGQAPTKVMGMKRGAFLAALAMLVAGCSSWPLASAGGHTYKTATQVFEAMDLGGMTIQCPNPDSPADTAAVKGAISENKCCLANTNNTVTFLVDVFPGKVSRSELIHNSVSKGEQQILSVLGPNWWVQTDGADVHKVQKILGGTIVPGPWYPDTN